MIIKQFLILIIGECLLRHEEDFVPRNDNQQHPRVTYAGEREGIPEYNWYLSSGATNHVTNDLRILSIRSEYKGNSSSLSW